MPHPTRTPVVSPLLLLWHTYNEQTRYILYKVKKKKNFNGSAQRWFALRDCALIFSILHLLHSLNSPLNTCCRESLDKKVQGLSLWKFNMLGADVIEEPRAAFKRTMHSTQGRYYTTSHICIVIVSHRGWKARSFSIDTQGTAGMLLSHQPTVCCPVRVRSDFFKRLSHSVVDTGRAGQWLRVAPTIYFAFCFSSLGLFFCAHRENYYICSIWFDYFGSRFSLRESCTFAPLSLSRSVRSRVAGSTASQHHQLLDDGQPIG